MPMCARESAQAASNASGRVNPRRHIPKIRLDHALVVTPVKYGIVLSLKRLERICI